MSKENIIPVQAYTNLYYDAEKKKYYAVATLQINAMTQKRVNLIEETKE